MRHITDAYETSNPRYSSHRCSKSDCMELAVQDIIQHALLLPSNARASLAEILLESLDFEEDFRIEPAWMAEIERRCRTIDEGQVELISGDHGLEQLQRKYA